MFYLIVLSLYVLFIIMMVMLCRKFLKFKKVGTGFVILILLLAPFYELFITKYCMWDFERTNSPLQEIKRTVEKPESVLWIDNVWPGFDEYGRAWMVENYLDGVHLKALALNDGNGNVYVYRANLENFAESSILKLEYDRLKQLIDNIEKRAIKVGSADDENKDEWLRMRAEYRSKLSVLGYNEKRNEEVKNIIAELEIYKRLEDVPEMKYRIDLYPKPLKDFQKKYMWCDEISISEVKKNKVLAFSNRCLGYSPNIGVNPLGGDAVFHGGFRLGDEKVYGFDDLILFEYANVNDGLDDYKNNLKRESYKLIQ